MPPASGSGVIRAPNFNIQQRTGPKLLRTVAKKHYISSTKSLVAAYNAATDENERAVLLGWLRKYGEGSIDCLKPEVVLEYAELAKVAHASEQDAKVLRKLVYGLGSLIRPGVFLDEDVANALFSALTWVDSAVYDDPAQLVVLANKLLFSLSSEPRLTKRNLARYEANFLALHQVFFHLHSIGRGDLLEEEKKNFRRAVAEKRDEMKLSIEHYPVFFHFELIQQAIERLEIEDAPSHLTQAKRHAVSGLYSGMHVFHFLRKLAGGDIDPASIEDAYRKVRAALATAGVSEREWYDLLQILTASRVRALKEEKKCEVFSLACDAAMEGQRKARREDEQKVLRFGIVQEMKLLASEKDSSHGCREEATKKLVELATNHAISENWIIDADILIAISDALHVIHITGEQNQETVEALRTIQQSCDERAIATFTAWLDGNTVEEKLQIQCQEDTDDEHEDLFAKTGAAIGYRHPCTIRSNMEDLKKTYLHDNFAKVPSLFEQEDRKHVKDMEHHVVAYKEVVKKRRIERTEERDRQGEEARGESSTIKERDDPEEYYEQKRKIITPVLIEDLFKSESLEAGVDEGEIHGVLLYGNPGSGKTCISKTIAHKWALGEILQEFKAVYVVPVRRLNGAKSRGVRGEALNEVIARTCFKQKGSDAEFEELKIRVDHDLDMTTTLLVFDGLDEADDDAKDLISEAEEGECRLLVLTRPYNLQGIQTKVDCQFECLGFNDQHLRNYINRELNQDEALKLIHSLQQDQCMWETAHTPVTAHILCSLSKEHGTSVEGRGKRASMFQIYNDMTNFVWKRFKEKPGASMANKDVVFGDLFEALRKGQILIEQRIVERCATSTNESKFFKESGFLLFVLEGHQYQFPHLTFQEYFAGRFIASSVKKKGSDEEMRVLEFIQKQKYNEKHDSTISFAIHAFSEGQMKFALQEVLSIVDEEPIEVLGIQHFFLKMRVLEAILEETDEDDLEDLLNDEKAIKLAKAGSQLLERTIDNILIREIVIEEFKKLSRVLEVLPQLLQYTNKEVMKMLSNPHDLTWKEMAKIEDVLKLARQNPKQSYKIVQDVLQLVEEPRGWCKPMECIRRLSSISENVPQHAGEVLPTLANGCVDVSWIMREKAFAAIGRVVAAAPQHAGEVLPMLANGCVDNDPNVRMKAFEVIDRVVAAAPQHAGEVLPTLAKGCVDVSWSVREKAFEVIGRVVSAAPQHASEGLPTLANGCVDCDPEARKIAFEAIGRIVSAAPQHAGGFLPTLANGCVDDRWSVREKAFEAIGRVVAAAPQHAGEVLPTLAKGCVDARESVREKAFEAVDRVVAAAPHHAGEVLSDLANGYVDDRWSVREIAFEAIGRVVAKDPQQAGEVLPMLANGCVDNDPDVRKKAFEVIGRVVAAAPQHAGEVLPTLAKGCVDYHRGVRNKAFEVIGRVVAAAPQHAGEVLPTLANGCVDYDPEARKIAFEAIGRIVSAAPQHAGGFLPTLAKGCVDDRWSVREKAFEAIGRVVAAAPQHASEGLPTLANGCVDCDPEARKIAFEAIGRIVSAAPQHAGGFLPTLANGCVDDRWSVREKAFEAIGRVVAAAPQHAGEVLPTLAKGCVDARESVREKAFEAVDRVVAAAPHHAGEVLSDLANGYVDDRWSVREIAFEAIGRVVAKDPQQAGEVLPMLANGCVDNDPDVRKKAFEVIGRVVAAAPQHAGEVLSTLANGCVDDRWSVREKAFEAIGRVVAAAPQHAGEVLPMLANGCVDNDPDVRMKAFEVIDRVDVSWRVRKKAFEAIGRVVAAAPQHAGRVLPTLANGCVDNHSDVREIAFEAIGRVVAAAPQHAGEVLPTLANGCVDYHRGVRNKVFETIGRVLAAAPQHAGEVLSTLANGCVDDNPDVRDAARSSLKGIKHERTVISAISSVSDYKAGFFFFFVQHSVTSDAARKRERVPFFLHTTSSLEIRKWSKYDIDRFVGYMRQEFDEKFPGLIEHL